jgi:hypothetical protein
VTATHRRFPGGSQSSDGGVLLLREAERKHGVCLRLSEAMPHRRDPDGIQHAMFKMVMSVFWRSPATRMPSTSTDAVSRVGRSPRCTIQRGHRFSMMPKEATGRLKEY